MFVLVSSTQVDSTDDDFFPCPLTPKIHLKHYTRQYVDIVFRSL